MTHLIKMPWNLMLGFLPLWCVLVCMPQAFAQDENSGLPRHKQDISQSREVGLPFTDVPADHWAYQALVNLAETYGCISGYPDGTYQGEAAVTRYEFAAGLDACLEATLDLTNQQSNQQQEIDTLIQSMEQSLEELRRIEQGVQRLENGQ